MRRRQINPNSNHRATVVILFLAAIASNPFVIEAQNASTIAGAVKSAAGEPVAGAYVKLSSASFGVAYIVVSQAQGRFSTPNLLPGKFFSALADLNQAAANRFAMRSHDLRERRRLEKPMNRSKWVEMGAT